MSVIGVVGIGAAGVAVNNFIINYTQDQYEAKVNELSNLIARLNAHLSELESLKGEIPSFWHDDNARKALDAINITMERTKNEMFIAQRLMDNFKETINNMENSKTTLGGFIEDAIGILGSIKS